MFKFKLNNGKVIDATKKSVAINTKGLKDGVRITTCDVINSATSITRFATEELSSIITDAGEISIDTTKDMSELINDIKQAFNTHNTPTQSESDENENGNVPSENPPTTITITFDFDGGDIDGYGSSEATVEYGTKGLPYKYHPHPTRENYDLVGWEPNITGDYEFTKDITVKAIWSPIKRDLRVTIEPNTIMLGSGNTAVMRVTDDDGNEIPISSLTIENGNPEIVSVNNETGEIRSITGSGYTGEAIITVHCDGYNSNSAIVNVVYPTEEPMSNS